MPTKTLFIFVFRQIALFIFVYNNVQHPLQPEFTKLMLGKEVGKGEEETEEEEGEEKEGEDKDDKEEEEKFFFFLLHLLSISVYLKK